MQSKSDDQNVDFEMLFTMRPAPLLFALAANSASSKQLAQENTEYFLSKMAAVVVG
jgi:hypothetical protein